MTNPDPTSKPNPNNPDGILNFNTMSLTVTKGCRCERWYTVISGPFGGRCPRGQISYHVDAAQRAATGHRSSASRPILCISMTSGLLKSTATIIGRAAATDSGAVPQRERDPERKRRSERER